MIKYLIMGAFAAAVAFLAAGLLSNLDRKPSFARERKRGDDGLYLFYLGCGLAILFLAVGVRTVFSGFAAVAAVYLVIALLGAAIAFAGVRGCVNNGECDSERFIGCGERETDSSRDEAQVESGLSHGGEVEYVENSSEVCFKRRIFLFMTRGAKRRAVLWGVVFAVMLALSVSFSAFTQMEPVEGGGNYVGDVVEKDVVILSYEHSDGVVSLTVDNDKLRYVILPYGTEGGDIDALLRDIDGERRFTVRGIVLDSEIWRRCFSVLEVRGSDGVCYLSEGETWTARQLARTEKIAVLFAASLLCFCVCGAYTVLAVKDKRRMAVTDGGNGISVKNK